MAEKIKPRTHAAGIMYRAGDEVLLLKRSPSAKDYPGYWCFPGGGVEDGESLEQAARRESMEEVGYSPLVEIIPIFKWRGFMTHFAKVAKFEPKLNDEHTEYMWAKEEDMPSPMHPGCEALMSHSAMDDSARQFNEFGWMTIEGNPITKVGVFPYLGSQIGDAEKTRIFMVYRPEEELNNPETIESFKLTPFINEHPTKLLGNVGSLVKTDDKRIEGVFGEKVYFEYPMLRANLRVYSADALDSIELGKEELSAGYNCLWAKESGVWVDPKTGESHPYQYVQRRIRGNHGALVVDGRSGPEISVMDHMTFKLDSKEQEMEMAELVKTVAALTAQISTFQGAMDANVQAVTELGAKVSAMDSDGGDDKDDKGGKKDDAMDEDDDKKDDETKAALDAALKRIAALEARPAAMDSGAIMADIARKTELANRISQHIGTFACDSMTFEQVAEYGAEKLGLPKDNAAIRVESYLLAKPAPAAFGAGMDSADKSTGAAFLATALN